MKKICVIGSLNVDLTIRLPRFHTPGETITATAFDTYAGGKGGNQAIAAAKELIKNHDLTASELGLSGKGSAKRVTGDKRNVVAPKYQDPISGKTWTGRGKSPAWLSAELAAGREKQEFLIQH